MIDDICAAPWIRTLLVLDYVNSDDLVQFVLCLAGGDPCTVIVIRAVRSVFIPDEWPSTSSLATRQFTLILNERCFFHIATILDFLGRITVRSLSPFNLHMLDRHRQRWVLFRGQVTAFVDSDMPGRGISVCTGPLERCISIRDVAPRLEYGLFLR